MNDAETYLAKVKAGLAATGKSLDSLTAEDLAPVDQFHVRGLEAVEDLVVSSGFKAGNRVLDIGSGTGGPARILAKRTGCTVTGVDLSEVSVSSGNAMSNWTGLGDSVSLIEGSATDLPFDAGCFDAAWSIHVGMFIEDKSALYSEAFRVLKHGGRLSIFDPVTTDAGDHPYPVPWARTAQDNHILSAEDLEAQLTKAGFSDVQRIDRTQEVRAWFAARKAAAEAAPTDGPPPLGLHLLVGPDFPKMTANAAQGVMEGTIAFAEIHAVKPA